MLTQRQICFACLTSYKQIRRAGIISIRYKLALTIQQLWRHDDTKRNFISNKGTLQLCTILISFWPDQKPPLVMRCRGRRSWRRAPRARAEIMGHLPFQARKLIREVNEGKRRQEQTEGEERERVSQEGAGVQGGRARVCPGKWYFKKYPKKSYNSPLNKRNLETYLKSDLLQRPGDQDARQRTYRGNLLRWSD